MKIINTFLHTLFPERADYSAIKLKTPELFVQQYVHDHTHDNIRALSSFREPVVRAAIHELKYHRTKHAATLLAALLERALAELPPSQLLPIPLSSRRQRERGFNQVAEILRQCRQLHGHHIDTKTLLRTRHTPPQTSLSRQERLTNLTDAFTYKPGPNHTEQPIIIIDDVTTTGATLRTATAAVQQYTNQPVSCIALAH